MSRARLLESRIAGVSTGPSYIELLLDVASREAPAKGLKLPQAALLRQVASWLERSPQPDARGMDVVVAPHRLYSVVAEAKADPRDSLTWRADVSHQRPEPRFRSYFDRVQEFVGRVREVDHDAQTFTAVLGGRVADPDAEVVGTFDRRLVGDRAFAQLQRGTTFTLVTGYQIHLDANGSAEAGSLATRVILHRPRPRTQERCDAAVIEATNLLED